MSEQVVDEMRELQWRLNTAAMRLRDLINESDDTESLRLRGKYEGVRLAESYVAEIVRTAEQRADA